MGNQARFVDNALPPDIMDGGESITAHIEWKNERTKANSPRN